MDCTTVQSLLFDYVKGVSGKGLKIRLKRHVDACPRCRRVHDGFKAMAGQERIVEWLEARRSAARRSQARAA